MKVALIGGSGHVGSRLLQELSRRNHQTTAIARDPSQIAPLPGVEAARGDADDPATLSALLAGHHAVISSLRFTASDPAKLIGAVKQAGVPRYLVVGGAGSLEVAPGLPLVSTPTFPEAYRAEALAGASFLERIREEPDLDWTFLSPSALFEAGERTGRFRLGRDQLLVGPHGSGISYEDFAVAMVDELERPTHGRQRFTVGY
jgi:putative NADH-flavin reductase